MLWQLAYAELFFSKKLWPDFSAKDLSRVIDKYKKVKEILELYDFNEFKKKD